MNTFELFCLIFYALDAAWNESKNEELGNYLSDANPFLFKDIGSANPEIYESFRLMVPARISIENSFDIAIKYVDTLDSASISNAFQNIGESRWKECAGIYLESPHKGQGAIDT